MDSIKIEWTSLILGIIFLILSALLVFVWSISTGMQYFLTRIFISLGIALIFNGIFKTSIKAKVEMLGLKIVTIGSSAIFVILLFFNPADTPQYQQINDTNRTINNINMTVSNPSDFTRPFLVEKKINLPLLEALALAEKEKRFQYMTYLSANPRYLATGFLESFNIYQEIKDEETLNELIELLNILKDINLKIKNLNEAHKKMILGTFQELQSAAYDFYDVNQKAEKAIFLYEHILFLYEDINKKS